jgi:hypothetical protein
MIVFHVVGIAKSFDAEEFGATEKEIQQEHSPGVLSRVFVDNAVDYGIEYEVLCLVVKLRYIRISIYRSIVHGIKQGYLVSYI